MPDSGEDRERELTELLDEVRALRQKIERLQAGQAGGPALSRAPELPPDDQVPARAADSEPPENARDK
jgi:hypothetical protein